MAQYQFYTAYMVKDWDVRNQVRISARVMSHAVEDWLMDKDRPGEYSAFVETERGEPTFYLFTFSDADLAFEFKVRWA